MTDHTCAKHEPGTAACRTRHGCPCSPCRTAANRARKRRRATSDMVPVDVVRRHVEHLLSQGNTINGIGVAAGLSPRHLPYIMREARTVHRGTARAILAVGASDWVDASGTARRIQALCCLGWSIDRLARELGHSSRSLWRWIEGARIRSDRAEGVKALYERLWDKPAPRLWERDGGPVQAMRYAQKRGWAPPMAWDDGYGPHGIDNPAATPSQWIEATRYGKTRDLIEDIEAGASLDSLIRAGRKPKSVERLLDRAGRRDLWNRLRPQVEWKEAS